ncbi:MAG: hypothetical protein KKF46_04380 [Nanoarchaeota archaeon]|nr:hypothetical protein [Nanoarchaeota archaeon]MBU1321573.1 hypothetical protein [Nanoarchaeota archaeon]MBU1598382.1 hypothetical protein [Nanoarchaeota archaeon]MBU2442129.1 hypothetical protein [Nanoarchaeota archaeon]
MDKQLYHFEYVPDDIFIEARLTNLLINIYEEDLLDAVFFEYIPQTFTPLEKSYFVNYYKGNEFYRIIPFPVFGADSKTLLKKQGNLSDKIFNLLEKKDFLEKKLRKLDDSELVKETHQVLELLEATVDIFCLDDNILQDQRSRYMMRHVNKVSEMRDYQSVGLACSIAHHEELLLYSSVLDFEYTLFQAEKKEDSLI